MAEPYLGQIHLFAFDFPPRGWAKCDGQSIPVSQNTALFSLVGTTYGGDGRTTFNLPDLRGRAAIHSGSGQGLTPFEMGTKTGSESHTLTVNELPAHDHAFSIDCNSGAGSSDNPQGTVPATSNENVYATSANSKMLSMKTGATGGAAAFSVRGPELAVNFCIALQGVFPPRS